MLRVLRSTQLRSFASGSKTTKNVLSRDDVEYFRNPSEELYDAFMKCHGQYRPLFKRSDLTLWKDGFGKDYSLSLMCLKGTKRVVCCTQLVHCQPIDPRNKPFVFIGLGWTDPEIRAGGLAALMSDMILQHKPKGDNINLVSHTNKLSRRFWHMLASKEELPDKGHDVFEAVYNSVYKAEDVFIPQDLFFRDITVKNAEGVPKKDMIAYDQTIYPYHRERYIVAHMRDTEGFGKVAYDEDGKVIGMAQAVVYPAGDCYLGPFYGDNPRVIQAMFVEILKDMKASGRKITHFEAKSNQICKDSYTWIKPFLKCELNREHCFSLVYQHHEPDDLDFSKVYFQTHVQCSLY